MKDLLVVGRVHTLNPVKPEAQALLIRSGRIVRVGTLSECANLADTEVERIELGEGCAVPGLVDAHGHVLWHGRALSQVSCEGAPSEAACAQRVAERAARVASGLWIQGRGWDHNRWPGARFPSAASLEAAAPRQPVALWRADCHALWVNERALQLAAIGPGTPDPPGGRILHHPDGNPSGVLVDTAANLVLSRIPPPTAHETEEAILAALHQLVSMGLTAVHDAGVDPDGLEVYRRLALDDRLQLRVYAMIDGQAPRQTLERQLELWSRTPELGRLTVRAVKFFADGALGSRGAALREPYADEPENAGLWLTEPAELRDRIALAAGSGFQPVIHAIGDRACSVVLGALEELGLEVDLARLRPRIEHLQTITEQEVALLAKIKPVISMQPIHAVGDAPWAEARLGHGTERQRGAYAWRRVLDSGVALAFGSDFPVDSFDPRLGIHAAELRLSRDSGEPWMAEQRLTRMEALRAYAEGGAIASFSENRRGWIQEGFDGDLTLFAQDLMAVPASELPAVKVTHTIVGGRIEYATS